MHAVYAAAAAALQFKLHNCFECAHAAGRANRIFGCKLQWRTFRFVCSITERKNYFLKRNCNVHV